jgi:hypothetical protein
MTKLDYHSRMRRVAFFALLAFAVSSVAFAPALHAQSQLQTHGPLPSVTSMGPGRTFTGPAPTVNSIAPRGIAGGGPLLTSPNCCMGPRGPHNPNPQPGHRPHHRPGYGNGGYGTYPIYATPYYYGDYSQSQASADDSAEADQYRGGPTIFDRRGNGEYNYQDRADTSANRDDSSSAPQVRADAQAPEEASDQPDTVLIFKDGHQLEVRNYAIQGNTLFDLTPGHARKVALSELDIPATQKQNDDRGIDFQVPASSSGS